MIDANALAKEIARVVLAHGDLHLGEFTLDEFLMQELNVDIESLMYVQNVLEGKAK